MRKNICGEIAVVKDIRKNTYYIRLFGGLGNQLFQICYMEYLKLVTGNDYRIILESNRSNASTGEAILNLNIESSKYVKDTKEKKRILAKYNLLSYYINRKAFLKALPLIICRKIGLCRQKKVNLSLPNVCINSVYMRFFPAYLIPDLPINKDKYIIEGSFQNRKFVDCIEKNKLRDMFSVRVDYTGNEYNKMILDSESVCVHIRLGDYLNKEWSYLNICNFDYFQKGMEQICKQVKNPKFFIFTNDEKSIESINNNMNLDNYNVVFVNDGFEASTDFGLMCKCKHYILSNSTFSWWAQYLCDNKEKVIIAPSVWNRRDADWENLYDDSWQLIEVD